MNKQKRGQIYRVHTMRLLARLGYASTRQIARAVWGVCDESSKKMAGRAVTWLLERGLVVVKREGGTVNGERLAAVTAAGARWLAEHGEPLPGGKAHARDWLRHAHSHRSACNSVYAARCGLVDDDDRVVWSEVEIRAKTAPVSQFSYRFENSETVKIPDLLARLTDGRYEWMEVENTWRSATDFTKLVEFLRAMFYNAKQTRFACVHLVVTAPGAKNIGARLRKRLTHDLHSGEPRQIKETDARILASHLKVSQLDHETLELSRVEF